MKWFIALALILLIGCAAERPVRPILGNLARLPKAALTGEFYFLKSVIEVKSPGGKFSNQLPGAYLKTNSLVKFEIREKSIDVVSSVKILQAKRQAERTPIVASFPIRNVDVLRKQNADGQDTNEEEETESRRPWNQRDFVVLDGAQDAQDEYRPDSLSSTMENIRQETGSLRFDVTRQLSDGTLVRERYHFLAKVPSTFAAKGYPANLQMHFGFFKTSLPGLDSYLQPSQSETQDWMNLRNLQKPVRYLVDPTFPEHLKSGLRSAIDQWNAALKQSTEKTPLEVVFEDTRDKQGDLRFNVITFDDTSVGHGILGYAPTFADPITGELFKGDVFLYGGTLAWVRLAEESWRRTQESRTKAPKTESADEKKKQPESQAITDFLRPFRMLGVSLPRLESPDLAEMVRKIAAPQKILENSRQDFNGEMFEHVTHWEAGQPLLTSQTAMESPIALEQKIFLPLVLHEVGHTLGLRHNFKGSADERHIAVGSKSSTVMDYAFLSSEETQSIGSYDYAAIEMGYGNRKSEQKRLALENFLFCSDEQIFSAKDGFCLPYDSGTRLTQILNTLFARYAGSYHFLNKRLDRIYYDESLESYLKKIGSLLLPIRQIYDHSAALVSASENNNLIGIWRLAGARIESDPSSDIDEVREISPSDVNAELSKNPHRDAGPLPSLQIDRVKLKAVIDDAKEAKEVAVKLLYQVVFKKEIFGKNDGVVKTLQTRPDVDQTDDTTNALMQRGVLADRLMAAGLLFSPSGDPLGVIKDRSISTTVAEGSDAKTQEEWRRRLLALFSQSVEEEKGAKSEKRWVPLNPPLPAAVRRFALDMLPKDPGFYSTGKLRSLIAVDRQLKNQLGLFGLTPVELLAFPFEPSRLNTALNDLKKGGTEVIISNLSEMVHLPALSNEGAKQIEKAKEIEKLNTLYALERATYNSRAISTPVTGSEDSLRAVRENNGEPTASFLHMTTHLFRAELLRQAHEHLRAAAEKEIRAQGKKPQFEKDVILTIQCEEQVNESASQIERLDSYLSSEYELLQKMHSIYSAQDPPR